MFFNDKIWRTFQLGQLRGRRDDGGFRQHNLGVLRCGAKTFVQTFQFATNPAHDLFLQQLCFPAVAEPSQIAYIGNPFLWGCFIYCCLNTLIGYGSFGEALNHWDASKVSIVTTLIPVFTMIFSTIGHHLAPDYFAASDMNIVSYVGAMVVVAGALLAVAGEKVMGLF